MSLISNGISDVRSFELPSGIWADGAKVAPPRLALVRWKSIWNDKFHHIYVNGKFSGVTLDTSQRQMVVQFRSSFESAVRIEVFAVKAEDAYNDFSNEHDWVMCQSGRVVIGMLRSQTLPTGRSVEIYSDNGSGEVDYENPVTDEPIKIWPSWQDKGGFGMSSFGYSDFGYDSAAAIGFGTGSFGREEFGIGADVFEWASAPMSAGRYKFGVKVKDNRGRQSSGTEIEGVTVIPAARPAEWLGVSLFNKQTNQLVLKIS